MKNITDNMVGSSPLAALRPSNVPGFGIQRTIPRGQNADSTPTKQRTGLFVNANGANCFPMTPGVPPSPTPSLLFDLSANFQTPQAPTPRRTLFADYNIGQKLSNCATPFIPPTPMPPIFSPMPHKTPLHPSTDDNISPNTDLSFEAMDLSDSPPIPKENQRPAYPQSRKKAASFARPALPRNRSLSSKSSSPSLFATPKKSASSIFSNITVPGTPDLEEIFNSSSPLPQRKSGSSPNLDTPVPRLRPLVNAHKTIEGSPIGMLNRKAVSRPKNKVRRTLSMFETADEVIKGKKEEILPPPISESSSESTMLPSFTHKDDTIRRINKATMVRVLEGHFKEQYDQCYIVDCRFEYEYQGGHIEGAININSNKALEETFINDPKEGKTLIIFHCEYSAHRAPRMANQLRSRDRQQNMHRYPELFYPEVYILEGGYSSFFKEHKEHCFPQKYVEMNDASHKQTCEKEMGKFRRNTKFARAQTFHFGSVANTDSGSPSVARRVPLEGAIAKIGGPKLGHPYPRPQQRDANRRAASY